MRTYPVRTPLFEEVLPLDTSAAGDALEAQLHFAIHDVFRDAVAAWGIEPDQAGYLVYVEGGGDEPRSALCVSSVFGGIRVAIASDGIPDPIEVLAWREVVRIALSRVEDLTRRWRWRATIGAPLDSHVGVTIAAPSDVGPVALSPPTVGEAGVEPAIEVVGATSRTTWISGRIEAGAAVRRLAALLSVAWRKPITRLRAPEPADFPTSSRRGIYVATRETVVEDVPDWLVDAWTRCDDDPAALAALFSYHEGLLLEPEHPSFVLVAYVASIEATGARYVPLVDGKGAMKRFDRGLKCAGLSAKERKYIREAYDVHRSPTVHVGELHSHERAFGQERVEDMFMEDRSANFFAVMCLQLREVGRTVVLLAVRGELPVSGGSTG